MKISPMGTELFHADGRTDMTKLTVVSRNFANVPKNAEELSKRCLDLFATIFSLT